MQVNYYYSLNNPAPESDDELLVLCRDCARKHAADVQWAQRGDDENECEFCGLANDEGLAQARDADYARIVGKPAPARRVA